MLSLWTISAKFTNLVNDESSRLLVYFPSPHMEIKSYVFQWGAQFKFKKRNQFIFLRKAVTPFTAWAKTFIFSADFSLEVIKFNF